MIVSAVFWVLESAIHYKLFDHGHPFELLPHNANELWMRSVISLLIIAFGYYSQQMIQRIRHYENARVETLQLTMRTVQDIVGNCFNQQQLMLFDLKKTHPEKNELYDEYETLIHDTTASINKIANMKSINTTETSSGIKTLDFN
jgi:hypothetical protein